jgi:hypothetical protein
MCSLSMRLRSGLASDGSSSVQSGKPERRAKEGFPVAESLEFREVPPSTAPVASIRSQATYGFTLPR